MKIKIMIIAVLSILIVGNSCKKILETQPQDFVSPEDYYNTEDDLNRSLSGVYRMLATDFLYGIYMYSLVPISDEYFYRPTSVTTGPTVLDLDSSEPMVNNFWTALYQGINRANLLLENINKPTMDETKRNAIKGETLFLRAYFYFLLVDHYGGVPLKLTSTKGPDGTSIVRTSIAEVYDQIIKDMKEAENLVNPISAYTYNGHVTKTTVQGILAKVYLTMAGAPLNDVSKYNDAIIYTEKVMTSGSHSLNPSYQQIFINHSAEIYDVKENLWEIEFSGDNTGAIRSAGRLGIVNGILSTGSSFPGSSTASLNTTKRQYDAYEIGDLRRDWSISNIKYTTPSGSTVAVESPVTTTVIYDRQVGKWRRKYEREPRAASFNGTNFPALRYADILLMYAEAYNHVNGLGDGKAYNAINQVRRRAFGLPVNTPVASVNVVSGITLLSTGNTGYVPANGNLPITFIGGGGTGATGIAVVGTTGKVTAVVMLTPGNGYTSLPTAIIGSSWSANTEYAVGQQVFNGSNLYTVTIAGTSTTTAPTVSSGTTPVATTGAAFTYAGVRATATVTTAVTSVDLTGFSQSDFLEGAIMPERARELAFEGARAHDLKRWNKYVVMMKSLKTEIVANAGTTYQYAGLAAGNVTERNVVFPIPSSELNINTLATQNKDW